MHDYYNPDRCHLYRQAMLDVSARFPFQNVEVGDVTVKAPETWSENAVRIAYSRWAYKAPEHHEKSVYDMCFRIAYALAHRGHHHGYFDTEEEAIEFCQKLYEAFLDQRWFPNSPQWFNTGIYDVYGVEGEDCGLWRVPDGETEAVPTGSRYVHPQVSACFIQSIEDQLTEGHGILPLVQDEARLFKMGSGTGTNFSKLRGKDAPLSNGGHSSGLISFLRIGDANAGAIKSGGTTRRAAKMVLLDANHPDILEFVEWKLREEDKIAQMAWASQQLQGKSPEELSAMGVPKALVDRISLGHTPNLLDLDFNGEAVGTVSGQNSNNSIRIPDAFFEALDAGGDWDLICPNSGNVVASIPAKKLWDAICLSAWACGDPGVQFIDTINAANPCPNSGEINASNPCVTGDTLITTSKGLVRIDQLLDEPFEVMCGDGQFREVAPAFCTGDRSVLSVVFIDGTILRCTPDHLVTTFEHRLPISFGGGPPRTHGPTFRDVPAKDLVRGDAVKGYDAKGKLKSLTVQGVVPGGRVIGIKLVGKGARGCVSSDINGLIPVLRGGVLLDVPLREVEAKDIVQLPGMSFPVDSVEVQYSSEPVYDITEPVTSHFVANGLVIHNCSEYLYLDDTSCNLASANLIKYLCPHTNRILWVKLRDDAMMITVALDISVSIAAFPSKRIAEGTWAHRTLGMGFSNLGGLLMALGVPYDSDKGRQLAADVAKCMMESAQVTSTCLAKRLGAFPAWEGNARTCDAVFAGQAGGALGTGAWRNAQHMVIAPCGTIGLGMDCDTLGIEPALGLMTYKKLADSDEVMQIPNRLVGAAMEALGFDEDVIFEFEKTLEETGGDFYMACEHMALPPETKGLEDVLATSLGTPNIPWEAHIKMLAAVQPHISGGISKTINMPEESTVEDVSRAYRMAHELGVKCVAIFRNGCKDAPYSVSKVPEAPEKLPETCSLEIAEKFLTGDHLDIVFRKLLVACSKNWSSEEMLKWAYVQVAPSYPGVGPEGIQYRAEKLVREAEDTWMSFRDPEEREMMSEDIQELLEELTETWVQEGRAWFDEFFSADNAEVTGWGRRKEPARLTHDSVHLNATVAGGMTVRVTVNRYPDTGTPSEIFVETGDSGSTMNALLDTVARLSSKCLQLGLDTQELTSILAGAKFDPSGLTVGPWEGAQFVNSPLGVVAKALNMVKEIPRPQYLLEDVPDSGIAQFLAEYEEGGHAPTSVPSSHLLQCSNPTCRSYNVKPSGTCHVCGDCGESIGGCS